MSPGSSWESISSHAHSVGAKFPALVAAQWALESSFGKHFSGKNNPFGLKGNGTNVATQEFYDGQWVTIRAGFIDFPSIEAAVEYLVVHWYKDWKHYKGVNNASTRDDAARLLQKEGYATDPQYASKLISLMNQYAPMPSPSSSPIRLVNAAKHFNGESHQIAAWNWLQEQLTAEEITEFAELYRASPPVKPIKPSNPLKVPYFSQHDNASGTGYRECFSSSCAMIAAFYGKVKTDDEYNKIRARYGDSTSSDAQVKALRALGLDASFIMSGTEKLLEEEVNAGRPVAVGWLHKGPVGAPSGDGHWSVVIGYTSSTFIHHDPNGAADLVRGNYPSTAGGKEIAYSRKNWMPRWRVNGTGGWCVLVKP